MLIYHYKPILFDCNEFSPSFNEHSGVLSTATGTGTLGFIPVTKRATTLSLFLSNRETLTYSFHAWAALRPTSAVFQRSGTCGTTTGSWTGAMSEEVAPFTESAAVGGITGVGVASGNRVFTPDISYSSSCDTVNNVNNTAS